jgi:hypothetical protein
MVKFRKNKTIFKIMAVFSLLVFTTTSFAAELSAGRILPKGKVALFHGNQKVGEFSSEAPLPEDTMLAVQGECGVKLKDLYLFAIDKSLFSVKTNTDSRTLSVQNGTVYFSLSSLPNTLVFQTPDGIVSTSQIMLNASSNAGPLKGYVHVSKNITRVGVLEGGSMTMMVGDGEPMLVTTGHELRLAQADIFKEKKEKKVKKEGAEEGVTEGTEEGAEGEGAGGEKAGGMSKRTMGIIGGAGAAAVLLGVAAGGGGSSSSNGGSPASP